MQSYLAEQYEIGIVCALPKEMTAVWAMLDEEYEPLKIKHKLDSNNYVLGRIHEHKVVIACLPAGVYGTNAAASVGKDMSRTFTNLRLGLLVGIGGGIPDLRRGIDVRLGDVVVSQPDRTFGGVVQYDLIKLLEEGQVKRKGSLNKPPTFLLTALSSLQSRSDLYESNLPLHLAAAYAKHPRLKESGFGIPSDDSDRLYCSICDPVRSSETCGACVNGTVDRKPRTTNHPQVHYGTIASANTLLRDAKLRDQLKQELGALCVEMEAAGLVDEYPCLVIRGICDYADHHKNDVWQKYAAMTAAAFAKELLMYIPSERVGRQVPTTQSIDILDQEVDVVRKHIEADSVRKEVQETRYQEEKHRDCHRVFKTTAYRRLKDFNPQPAAGTCQWVFQNPKYRQWRDSPTDNLLWISADPGCGKSVLSKRLVDTELRSTKEHKICYFFFKDNDEQNNIEVALCALLHQVFDQIPQLLRFAMPAWEKHKETLVTETEELWPLFRSVVAERADFDITFVMDALDECREADRKQLIQYLTQFYRANHMIDRVTRGDDRHGRVKFLVTSRPYFDVQREFHMLAHFPSIRLYGEDENELIGTEIEIVVRDRVKEMADILALSAHTREKIEAKLLQMRHRTYLWLHLAIEGLYDSFRNSLRPEDEMIETVPSTIADAYEKILSKVSKKKRDDVRSILSIIVGARRSLTIQEMAFALGIAISPPEKSLSDALLDSTHLARQIRDWCGLFVFINDSKIYLIHQTAKEFLLGEFDNIVSQPFWKQSLSSSDCDKLMARICVRTLSSEILRNLPTASQVFVLYAVEHWSYHVRCTESLLEDEVWAGVLSLYDASSARNAIWRTNLQAHSNDYLQRTLVGITLAAHNGHARALQLMMSNFSQSDSNTARALVLAASCGHTEAVKTLLQSGVTARPRSVFEPNALVSAARNGHSETVAVLLDTIGDINDPASQTARVLDTAIRHGHEKTVSSLLDHGVEPGPSPRTEYHHLLTAVTGGHESIVQLLLDRGANPNAMNDRRAYVLHAATNRGNHAILSMLLHGGADVDTVVDEHGTALQIAALKGRADVVKLLLDQGAGVNVMGGKYGSALQAAAISGSKHAVQLLLSRGADTNAPNGIHDNTLPAAVAMQNVVQLLLDNGADVNLTGGRYGNALQAAAARGYKDTLELLIDHGADVNAMGGEYGSALQAAALRLNNGMVPLLLAKGANVNLEGGKYGNALQAAVVKGDRDTIKLLLDHGANVNAVGGKHHSALQAAAALRNNRVVQLLLEKGADADVTGGPDAPAIRIWLNNYYLRGTKKRL